jgi:alkaline phosphatase D
VYAIAMRKHAHAALAAAALSITALAAAARAMAGDPPVVDPPLPRLLRAGPVIGYAGPDAVAVWAAPPAPETPLVLAYAPEGAPPEAEVRRPFPPVAAGADGTTLRIGGLAPATAYRYRVLVGGRAGHDTSGSFRTGPAPGAPVRARFSVVSCMNAKRYPRQPAWVPLLAEKPDLLLQLGDAVYADSTRPEVLRAWHIAQRRVPEYAEVLRVTPTLVIWDDHDFGGNDSDGSLPGKERSLELFRALWPNPSCGLPETPGIFFKATYGDVDIFMTDGRYYRSPDAARDDESKKMLGDAQFAWLERELRASRATFKLVASGSTIDVSLKDCWKLYSHDRARLLGLTREVPGIVFLTGDVHQAVVLPSLPPIAGYPVYEICSSGVAVNPTYHYYVTIDVDTAAADPTLAVHAHKLDGAGKDVSTTHRVIRRSELRPVM